MLTPFGAIPEAHHQIPPSFLSWVLPFSFSHFTVPTLVSASSASLIVQKKKVQNCKVTSSKLHTINLCWTPIINFFLIISFVPTFITNLSLQVCSVAMSGHTAWFPLVDALPLFSLLVQRKECICIYGGLRPSNVV